MTFLRLVILLGCCIHPYLVQAQSADDQVAIQSIMDQQTRCWNAGDLKCFMEGYWHSDSLMFISKTGITYGYDSTLARYQRRYPDRAAMGQLRFDVLSLEAVSEDAYFMVGQWSLARSVGDLEGHFTLLFRCIEGKWSIVMDHTS